MDVTSNLELINLNQFNDTKNVRKGTRISKLQNGDKWVPLKKQTDQFIFFKNIKRFGVVLH